MAFFALLAFLLGLFAFNVSFEPESSGTAPTTVAPTAGRAVLEVRSPRPPLTIGGRGFKPRESVRITGAGTMLVTASRNGTFVARLGGDACSSFTIVAVGSKGSRASLNFSSVSDVHCLDPP